jgi:hypothetical protein
MPPPFVTERAARPAAASGKNRSRYIEGGPGVTLPSSSRYDRIHNHGRLDVVKTASRPRSTMARRTSAIPSSRRLPGSWDTRPTLAHGTPPAYLPGPSATPPRQRFCQALPLQRPPPWRHRRTPPADGVRDPQACPATRASHWCARRRQRAQLSGAPLWLCHEPLGATVSTTPLNPVQS